MLTPTLLHIPWSDVDLEAGFIIERYGLEGGPTKSAKPWRMEDVPLHLGHSSIRVTQRYAKLLSGALHELTTSTLGIFA